MTTRRGFALIAVLWVVVALGALSAGTVARARADAVSTGDRVARMRGRWAAEACLAVAQSRIEAGLKTRDVLEEPPADSLAFANGARCVTTALDPGTRIRRDSAPASLLARFDSMLTALGHDSLARDTLLTSWGDGRINVNTAPLVVLAALPGLGDDALRVVAEARAWHRPFAGMDDLASRLPPHARARLMDSFRDIMPWVSFQTSGLVLTARGWVEGARATESIELLVVNGGNRMAVIQRRMW
jgi:type II secretory pathway component PulK